METGGAGALSAKVIRLRVCLYPLKTLNDAKDYTRLEDWALKPLPPRLDYGVK